MRILGLLAAGALAAMAQPARPAGETPLFRQTFDSDTGGWMAMGAGAVVRQATSGAHGGAGALAIEYDVQPGRLTGAVSGVPPAFAHMGRMRFWARNDRATALGVMLAEKMPGGGRYSAWVWLPANEWQQVELVPRDFLANDGPQDPPDADGKLDLDAVQNIALLDMGQFFGQIQQNGPVPLAVDRPTGKHTLLIDDFELLPDSPPDEGAGVIDRFHRGCLQWVSPGGMQLRRAAESPLNEPALEASYEQTEGQVQVLVRRIGSVDLSHAGRLNFDVASENEATLAVSLEMKKPGVQNGPRYTMTVFPPGGREVFHVSLKLSDFEGPGKLDARQLKSLAVADISANAGGAGGHNKLWIGNVSMPPE